jgi:hypothetical protein
MPQTLDQFAVQLIEGYVRKVQPARADTLLSNGLGVVIRQLVDAAGVPSVTGDEIAAGALRALGFKGNRPGGLHRPVARGRIPSRDSASVPGRVIDVTGEVIR